MVQAKEVILVTLAIHSLQKYLLSARFRVRLCFSFRSDAQAGAVLPTGGEQACCGVDGLPVFPAAFLSLGARRVPVHHS